MNLDWNDIHYFLQLVENQTLTATAAALDVEHSTVARRIERLEKQLGLHLFDRINKRYLLTADGDRLYQEAKKLQFNVRQFTQLAQEGIQTLSEVRISVPPFIANSVLSPHLGEFYRRFPHIRLVLVSDVALSNLYQRQADIAIRLSVPSQNELVARRLCNIDYYWYAHRDYLAHTAESDWQFLDLNINNQQVKWVQQQLEGKTIRFACNDFLLMQSAIRQQLGIGFLPELYRLPEFEPALQMPPFALPLYLLMHQDVRQSKSVREVADFLVEVLGD
ncbi:LysR family transcriptional regulator [Haemophilus paracuniculus]|uniref:LysR family transcriptional regulator n=1 Tax=Haemophilus paracuniculus TaxID=734 RepID=A0A1T0AS76_9PAST|nr:LysR family transcriptional regulator [Haemophilus paracuniculus]OOR99183.1 LysR family transcriptional regulator [Haemophilus paracuniculus]